MSVVSVSMPEELLSRIDQFADDHGYTGRSEVLREASRNLLGEFEDKKLEGRDLMGVVTVVIRNDYKVSNTDGSRLAPKTAPDGGNHDCYGGNRWLPRSGRCITRFCHGRVRPDLSKHATLRDGTRGLLRGHRRFELP